MNIMRNNDPACLSEEASLGVLSAGGNFEAIIPQFVYGVN